MTELPQPTGKQVLAVLRQTHPDAVDAAYWRVQAQLLADQFQGRPTLSGVDPVEDPDAEAAAEPA